MRKVYNYCIFCCGELDIDKIFIIAGVPEYRTCDFCDNKAVTYQVPDTSPPVKVEDADVNKK